MKAIPHFLVAATLLMGSACSTANTGSASSTDTSDATGATSTTGAAGTSSVSGAAGTTGTSDMAGSDAARATLSNDMMVFTGTFATMSDQTFLLNAASSNQLEIQLGQLAVQHAVDPDVKKYGQMMTDHHTNSSKELSTIAAQMNVTLPQTMVPVHQTMVDRLKNKTGKDFDEEYMDMMESAHKMDIAMFEVKSKAAEKPFIKTFATKTLPMLRSHQTMANDIEKKVD